MIDMIYPTRKIREVGEFTAKFNYYDNEKVVQEDGKIAVFTISRDTQNDGWKFDHYIDHRGFMVWTKEDHDLRWDDKLTYEQLLLISEKPYNANDVKYELTPNFALEENEVLHKYEYGGIMSMRGGWYITHKDHPPLILFSIQTRIS